MTELFRQSAPGAPTESAPASGSDAGFSRSLGVRVVRYQAEQVLAGSRPTGVRTRDQEFGTAGDHLHVLRVAGGDLLAVRLGIKSNDFVPIREGMTLALPFDSFTVRLLADRLNPNVAPGQPPWSPPSEVLFVVSYGDVVKLPGVKRFGFEPGCFAYQLPIDGTQLWDIFDPAAVVAVLGDAAKNLAHLMRWGGTLRLHNRGTVPIYIGSNFAAAAGIAFLSNAPGGFDTWMWQLDPGQKEEFQLESGLYWNKRVGTSSRFNTLVATTLGGPANLGVLISNPCADLTDPDALVTGQAAESLAP